MSLPDGHYQTKHGSELWIDNGRSRVAFDWFEEPGACCDCEVQAYEVEGYLVWYCSEHQSGQAKLYPVPWPANVNV